MEFTLYPLINISKNRLGNTNVRTKNRLGNTNVRTKNRLGNTNVRTMLLGLKP